MRHQGAVQMLGSKSADDCMLMSSSMLDFLAVFQNWGYERSYNNQEHELALALSNNTALLGMKRQLWEVQYGRTFWHKQDGLGGTKLPHCS
jgi:hypothetical protein